MKVNQPIFIVGVGRSGSSIFHQMMCWHPQVAWLSKLCDVFPRSTYINRGLMQLIDVPLVNQIIRQLIRQEIINPSEAYTFWEFYCSGFRRPCRDLTAADVTLKKKRRLRQVLSQVLTPKRERLLVKITGWSRMDFLQDIFEDAKFIHIVRDGRAVVNSMVEVDWWEGWRGPHNWRWGELTPQQQEEWEKYDRSFVALAAIELNILMEAMQQAKQKIKPENFLEIKYEQLCADPVGIFKDVIQFCDLDWQPEFEQTLRQFNLKDSNYKWQEDLTEQQQEVLEQAIAAYQTTYGYQ